MFIASNSSLDPTHAYLQLFAGFSGFLPCLLSTASVEAAALSRSSSSRRNTKALFPAFTAGYHLPKIALQRHMHKYSAGLLHTAASLPLFCFSLPTIVFAASICIPRHRSATTYSQELASGEIPHCFSILYNTFTASDTWPSSIQPRKRVLAS